MTNPMDDFTVLQDLAQRPSRDRPTPESLVAALLAQEKVAKQTHPSIAFADLLGDWQLRLITGTKRSRQQAGIILGAGRWLPHWLKITLSYRALEPSDSAHSADSTDSADLEEPTPQPVTRGEVANQVAFGALRLTLTGPTAFFLRQRILAFDFTELNLSWGDRTLYQGPIRQGPIRQGPTRPNTTDKTPTRRQRFEATCTQPQFLKTQAFFSYFWVTPEAIAARGRGGGLALWTRQTAKPH